MDITKYGHRERRGIRLKKYNKLVRDKIPEIIKQDGSKVVCHVLSEEEYIAELDKKLSEEVNRYVIRVVCFTKFFNIMFHKLWNKSFFKLYIVLVM